MRSSVSPVHVARRAHGRGTHFVREHPVDIERRAVRRRVPWSQTCVLQGWWWR